MYPLIMYGLGLMRCRFFFFIFHLDRVFENMIALIKPSIAVHLLKITHNDDKSTYLDLLPYFLNSHIKENQKNQVQNNPCFYDDRLWLCIVQIYLFRIQYVRFMQLVSNDVFSQTELQRNPQYDIEHGCPFISYRKTQTFRIVAARPMGQGSALSHLVFSKNDFFVAILSFENFHRVIIIGTYSISDFMHVLYSQHNTDFDALNSCNSDY